jgi:hypothetical protein
MLAYLQGKMSLAFFPFIQKNIMEANVRGPILYTVVLVLNALFPKFTTFGITTVLYTIPVTMGYIYHFACYSDQIR